MEELSGLEEELFGLEELPEFAGFEDSAGLDEPDGFCEPPAPPLGPGSLEISVPGP